MSTLYNGSICLSDIPKDKITKSEKNGKSYLNFNLWVNDEKDQYGNIGSLNVSQSKEQREAGEKKVYFGNIKPVERNNNAAPQQAAASVDLSDDLPF